VIKKGDEAVVMGHGKQFKTTVTGMVMVNYRIIIYSSENKNSI